MLSYDYFDGIKEKKCSEIMSIEYMVGTDAVTNCIGYDINKFWDYTVGYYVIHNLLLILVAIMPIMLIGLTLEEMY